MRWNLVIFLTLTPGLGRFEYPHTSKFDDVSCTEFVTTIGDECAFENPPKDEAAKLCMDADEDLYQRFVLSVANRMYIGCSSWCVYDITDDAFTAFMWIYEDQCWLHTHEWLCFEAEDERQEVRKRMRKVCPGEFKPSCENDASDLLEHDLTDNNCIALHRIDAVNEPDHYNRRLRCRCSLNGENTVIRRARTAVHCTEDRWSENSIRIEMSLLNGMYQTCENWCLFDLWEPNTRYWAWDPWNECWNDDPMESSVCDEVVTGYNEEVQYANVRSNNFCGPLGTPQGIDYVWRVGKYGMDCVEACKLMQGEHSECSARVMVAVNNDADNEFVRDAFSQAGVFCRTISVGDKGMTGTPAHRVEHCITTSGSVEPGLDYCERPIVSHYQRLCACTV